MRFCTGCPKLRQASRSDNSDPIRARLSPRAAPGTTTLALSKA